MQAVTLRNTHSKSQSNLGLCSKQETGFAASSAGAAFHHFNTTTTHFLPFQIIHPNLFK